MTRNYGSFTLLVRYIPTKEGSIHVFDSGHPPFEVDDQPPLILLHGMFTNSYSVALLGIMLATGVRKGVGVPGKGVPGSGYCARRVLIPDLLAFDHSLSKSRNGDPDAKPSRQVRYLLLLPARPPPPTGQ